MHPRLKPLLWGAVIAFCIVAYDWSDGGVEAWRPAPEPVVAQRTCLSLDINGNVVGRCVPDETECRLKVDLGGNIVGRTGICR